MCARTAGTLPKPRLHKRGYQRIRVGGRDFTLGKPGSQQADERYKTILAAWAEGGGRLPDDFQLESAPGKNKSLKPTKHIPDTNQICVADLLCTAFVDVEEKSWRWYLLRRVAVCLEPYANLPAVEFGPRLLGQVAKTMATTPMQATRGGESVPPTKKYVREVVAEIKRIFSDAVAREELPPERLVALDSLKKLPIDGARDSQQRDAVLPDIVEDTCAVLPPVFADLIRFIMLTGCRPAEATGLTPAMLDTKPTTWVARPHQHKNKHRGHERQFGIGSKARAILKPWLAGKGENDLIFPRSQLNRATTADMIQCEAKCDRERFDKDDLRRLLNRAIKVSGSPHWTPYQLRHRGLTEIRQAGGRDAAQAQAGHVNGDMTERYAKPTLGDAAEIIESVG
jgi:integrase